MENIGKRHKLEDLTLKDAPILSVGDSRYLPDLFAETYDMMKIAEQRAIDKLDRQTYESGFSRYKIKFGLDEDTAFRNMERVHNYFKYGGLK